MPIISMSLDEKTLSELDSLQHELGFFGRSETIRAGIKMLISEKRQHAKLSGKMKCVLFLVHNENAENQVAQLKHEFENIIPTQIHSHLKDGKCLEIFMLDGDASQIKELVRMAQTNRKIEHAKLIVP